jgi:hypothetical protein
MMTPARREVHRVFLFAMQSQSKGRSMSKESIERRYYSQLNIVKIMKELIEILTSEDKSFEGLPKWVYIFAVPAGLLLACMIGGTLS